MTDYHSQTVLVRATVRLDDEQQTPDPYTVASLVQTGTGWLVTATTAPELTHRHGRRDAVYTFPVWGYRDQPGRHLDDELILQVELHALGRVWVATPNSPLAPQQLPGVEFILDRAHHLTRQAIAA